MGQSKVFERRAEMDLFIDPAVTFEKTAAEVTLPEDPNAWPNEILQELFKQAPYVSDFDPHIVMDRVDGEKGYGFGHIEIGNKTAILPSAGEESAEAAGVHKVRVPVIVKQQKLQPFDVLVTEDSKMLPLTESRLRQALFRPQAFDITSQTPGDHSMIGQLYPPYRQNYGFGGGGATMSAGMGKEGSSSLLKSVLPNASAESIEKVASQIFEDETLQALFLKNSHSTAGALSTLASALAQGQKKTASVYSMVKAEVAQLLKGDEGGYLLKTANPDYWAPFVQEIHRGEAVRRFGPKIVLAADLNGGVTVAEGPEVQGEEASEEPELISSFGTYKVCDLEGGELVGYVFPNLLDLDGTALPLSLFTNGTQAAVQGEIVGSPATNEIVSLPSGHPRGHGVFWRLGQDGPEATIPFDLQGSISQEGEIAMMGSTFDGHPVQVVFNQPNLEKITFDGQTVMIPESFQWLPLDQENEVALASKPEEVGKTAEAKRSMVSVVVRSDGSNNFSFEGLPVEKLGSVEKNFLDLNESLFLLAGLGVEASYGQKKLAEAAYWSQPVQIRVGRMLKTAGKVNKEVYEKAAEALSNFPAWRTNLVKEAATIPDPVAVDTVLSLNFLNPENLTHFISCLPSMDKAQESMCEMLIASRLGMREIPTGSLERAIKAVEEVIEGLKIIAFQQN